MALALDLVEFMDNARQSVDVGGVIEMRHELVPLFDWIAEHSLATVVDNDGRAGARNQRLIDLDLDAHSACRLALDAYDQANA